MKAGDDGRFEVRLLVRDCDVTAERIGEDAPEVACGVLRGGSTGVALSAK